MQELPRFTRVHRYWIHTYDRVGAFPRVSATKMPQRCIAQRAMSVGGRLTTTTTTTRPASCSRVRRGRVCCAHRHLVSPDARDNSDTDRDEGRVWRYQRQEISRLVTGPGRPCHGCSLVAAVEPQKNRRTCCPSACWITLTLDPSAAAGQPVLQSQSVADVVAQPDQQALQLLDRETARISYRPRRDYLPTLPVDVAPGQASTRCGSSIFLQRRMISTARHCGGVTAVTPKLSHFQLSYRDSATRSWSCS